MHSLIRLPGASAHMPGHIDAMIRQLATSISTLSINGHRRHILGLTGWMVQMRSQNMQYPFSFCESRGLFPEIRQ
jgi:hypothetical protein